MFGAAVLIRALLPVVGLVVVGAVGLTPVPLAVRVAVGVREAPISQTQSSFPHKMLNLARSFK